MNVFLNVSIRTLKGRLSRKKLIFFLFHSTDSGLKRSIFLTSPQKTICCWSSWIGCDQINEWVLKGVNFSNNYDYQLRII